MLERIAVLWTIRAALLLYLLALTLRFGCRGTRVLPVARLAWTVGFVLFCTHVLSAFHFVHYWSHAAAYAETARRTAATIGWDWGGGIYVNYVFAAVWGMDVAYWWAVGDLRYHHRGRLTEWAIQFFLAFIAFNSTVVFGPVAVRWWGAAGSLWLVGVCLWHFRQKRGARRERAL